MSEQNNWKPLGLVTQRIVDRLEEQPRKPPEKNEQREKAKTE